MPKKEGTFVGSGNVYQDLGFKNPEEWATKAALASKIYNIIEERGLSQKEAAKILGIDQPGVSDLRRGRFRRFSVARMFSFLSKFDQDIDIVIRPKINDTAKINVTQTQSQPEYVS